MKRIFLVTIGLFLAVCATALLGGCKEEDGKFKNYVYATPEVTGVSPESGYPNSRVTITGNDFGGYTEPVKVYFGGILVEKIISCKNNCIVVEVPKGALSGNISLEIWKSKLDNIGSFKVVPFPTFAALTTGHELGDRVANPGAEVTVTGTGFGTDQTNLIVKVSGTITELVSLTDTELKFKTSENYTSGEVTVTINGYVFSLGSLLNPEGTGDVSVIFLKNYMQPFVIDPGMTDEMKGSKVDWALPADWIVNEAARTSKNVDAKVTCSGLHFKEKSGQLILQGGWGSGYFTNGKMYQVLSRIPAGKYKLSMNFSESYLGGASSMYFAVVKGSELPDIGLMPNAESVLGYYKFTSFGAIAKVENVEFTLSETTEDLAIGLVGSFNEGNSAFRINAIKLERLAADN